MRRRTFALLVMLLFVAMAAFTILRAPAPVRPAIAFHVVDIATNSIGPRAATIAITNQSATLVMVYMPRVIIEGSNESIPVSPWSATMMPGTGAALNVIAPASDKRWRLSVYVYNDLDLASRLKIHILRRRMMPHFINSDWQEPITKKP